MNLSKEPPSQGENQCLHGCFQVYFAKKTCDVLLQFCLPGQKFYVLTRVGCSETVSLRVDAAYVLWECTRTQGFQEFGTILSNFGVKQFFACIALGIDCEKKTKKFYALTRAECINRLYNQWNFQFFIQVIIAQNFLTGESRY